MKRFLRILGFTRRLFWFLELLMIPQRAAEALLIHPQVARWLERQSADDQRKIREAAPLVVEAIVASLD